MNHTNKGAKADSASILRKGQLAAKKSVITLAAIGIVEITIAVFTGSITLTADGFDSIADAMISFIVWFGIMFAKKSRSNKFQFGYRKIEVLAAFIAAIIIIILGIFIVIHAIDALDKPKTFQYPEIVIMTLIGAGSVSLHRAFVIRKIAIESDLVSLKLDAKNSIKDGTASFVGVASVVAATYFGFPFMDAIGGIIIAGYIFIVAYTAIKESALVLVDAVDNPLLSDNIKWTIEKKFNIKTNEVFLRPIGNDFNAEIHILLPSETRLDETNKIVNDISHVIKDDFALARVVIVPLPDNVKS